MIEKDYIVYCAEPDPHGITAAVGIPRCPLFSVRGAPPDRVGF